MGPIRVVIPCCDYDQNQAERLIRWIAELGKLDAKGYLCCARNCKVDYLMSLMKEAFVEVGFIDDAENIKSNWREPGHHNKSAAGPNSLFRQVAWYFNLLDPVPWLFLEPDAYPCRKDWYDVICAEYRAAQLEGKGFLGARVLSTVPGSDIPTHMSGVAVYHHNTPGISSAAVIHSDTAFDITGAKDFMARARFTTAIIHHFRGPEFESMADLDARVPSDCAIYHASKSGSILPWLRQRIFQTGVVHVAKGDPERSFVNVLHETHAPVCDIYIKTWKRDWSWLEWCLKSIHRFAHGFRKVIVVSEEKPPFEGFEWIQNKDWSPGYLGQQATKLRADLHTNSDYIFYMDSDCCLTRDITPLDFMVDGKTKWRVTPFENARNDQSVWIGPMEKFVGKRPTHECMREHPFLVPRWALREVQKFCEYKHGMPIWEYVMGQADPRSELALTFSEWNCLGWFLFTHHHDRFEWVDDKDANPCVFQGFTHGGEKRMNEDLAKMREIVEGAPEPPPEKEKPVQTISAQIRTHVEALKAIVMESKVGRTQMLHQELRSAGLLGPVHKRKIERNELAGV